MTERVWLCSLYAYISTSTHLKDKYEGDINLLPVILIALAFSLSLSQLSWSSSVEDSFMGVNLPPLPWCLTLDALGENITC